MQSTVCCYGCPSERNSYFGYKQYPALSQPDKEDIFPCLENLTSSHLE